MSKGEQTRQQILEKAAPLFNQRGFHGCSMADVMEATGLEKGGLYRHFSSKEELAQAAFRHAVATSLRIKTQPPEPGATAMETLRAMIARFVETKSGIPGGCPLMNTAIDADDGNEALRKLAREAFDGWRGRLVAVIEQASEAREIRRSADSAWLADTIISTLEGALMLSRLERRKEPLHHAQRSLEIILESVQR